MQVTPTGNIPIAPTSGAGQPAARAGAPVAPQPANVEVRVKAFERALIEAAGLTEAQATQVRVSLSVDESTNRVIAKMYNDQTGELLRQMPTDQMLRNAALIREMLGAAVNAIA